MWSVALINMSCISYISVWRPWQAFCMISSKHGLVPCGRLYAKANFCQAQEHNCMAWQKTQGNCTVCIISKALTLYLKLLLVFKKQLGDNVSCRRKQETRRNGSLCKQGQAEEEHLQPCCLSSHAHSVHLKVKPHSNVSCQLMYTACF